ncbi:WD repeat-containing protein 52 [Fasciola hepatica]|uniref:Cilia- and flagella-associated protein 44 n=1 Tax=Fasciola hepatica TaxID=6192 RepID=A0A4E0RBJ4_FASHE|nr:WD repeat-containing protein 52 [Fasciola hepatica]
MSDNEFFPAEDKVCPVDEGDDPFLDGQADVDLQGTPEDEQQENNNANEQPDKNPETEQRGVREPETEGPKAEGGTEALSVEDDEKVVKLRALDSGRDTEDMETDKENDESVRDSESVEEAVKAKKQPKKEVHPDFVYTMESFVSKPFVEPDSGIPQDLVSLVHSFGFDALRRNNLQLLENNIICYIVGNYVEIMNLLTLEKRFIRSLSGIGIGAFSVHPKRNVIALAEKGDRPMVCIYRYPQLDLYRLLPEGTQKEYSSCEFSTDGEMLAVVGSDPDYMLTLWEWRNEQIVLRAKAFSQDIYRVAWSTDLAGVLTTGGVGHIRFWKMADTFTGLKLQGKLGKFGKTELSDIEGFVTLPDGKVLSGSSWGNLLVWEGDLIKVQISRKNKRPCHTGLIMQIVMDEGELMTVGQDGWIRTWDFETVDTAECLEEGGVYELEPMNELQVSPSAKLMYMVKVQEADCTVWYAQDGDGAIWKLDLSFSHTSLAPESLVRFHSGAITDCVTSPYTHTAATIGRDGRIFIYDMIDKKQIVRRRFPSGGSKLIWCPPQVDPKGKLLVAGFDDGVVRVLQFGENPEPDPTRKAKHFALLDLGQALKPHVKPVTTMAYNGTGTFFVTGVPCPSPDDVDHSKTFTLPDTAPIAGFNMLSVKSRLLHDEDSAEKLRRYEIEKKARNDLRKARAEREPETEEDAQRLDDEEELIRQGLMAEIADWAPTYPSERSPLVYAALDPSDPNYFWTSFDKFDCGYIYKCRLGDPPISAQESLERAKVKATAQSEVLSASSEPPVELPSLEEMSALDKRLTPTEPTDATRVDRQKTITCWTFSKSGNRLLFGMKDGTVRVQLLERPFDMTSFKGYWSFRMHDENRGGVNCIALSYDEKFLMSVGDDGTFFLCELMSEELQNKEITEFRARIPSAYEAHQTADDIADPKAQSIEQAKQKAEFDRLVSLAEQKKADTRKKVTELRLRFRRLKEQNERLPERIRLRKEWRSGFEKTLRRFRKPLDFDRIVVHAFCTGHCVSSLRTNQLSEEHTEVKQTLARIKAERIARTLYLDTRPSVRDQKKSRDADSDANLGAADGSQAQMKGARGLRIARQLHVLEEAQRKRRARREQWDALLAMKPADDYEDPADLNAIAQAKEHMGDFKLKSSHNYVVPDRATLNAFEAKYRLVEMVEEAFTLRHQFNLSILALRDKKKGIIDELTKLDAQLLQLQDVLPPKEPIIRLHVPTLLPEECPEKQFAYNRDILQNFKQEMLDGTSGATDSKVTAPSSRPDINANNLTFSESLFPSMRNEPDTSVVTESTSEGETRAVIWLPVHCLAYDDYTVSLKRNYSRCSLPRPPPTSLIGVDLTATASTSIVCVCVCVYVVVAASSTTYTSDKKNYTLVPIVDGKTEVCVSELEERMQRQIYALYQRDELVATAGRLVRCFDAQIRLARHSRFKLDLLLKRAELHQLTLFTEFRLLKDFEKSESVLSEKKQVKDEERQELYSKLLELNTKIEARKKELERLSQKEHQLHEEFKATLGEGHKFTDFLTKVFKKRIKRKKQEAANAGSDESEGSSSSDDSSFDASEDESEEEENILDLDSCPVGCPLEDFENTCAIRERRLDVEDEMLEEKKQLELLRKDLEAYSKKQRVVDAGLKQAQSELEAFQLEKQRKLNELDAIVILRLNQIQYHSNDIVPADLSSGLIFVRQNLYLLFGRIVVLEEEKKRQRREQKDAKDKHVLLQKHKKLFQKELEKLSAICDREMIEKFGKVDDIERMEGVVVNPKVEELTTKMLILQEQFSKEEADMEERIRASRDACVNKLRENTAYLTKTLMLFNEKEALQNDLNKKRLTKVGYHG